MMWRKRIPVALVTIVLATGGCATEGVDAPAAPSPSVASRAVGLTMARETEMAVRLHLSELDRQLSSGLLMLERGSELRQRRDAVARALATAIEVRQRYEDGARGDVFDSPPPPRATFSADVEEAGTWVYGGTYTDASLLSQTVYISAQVTIPAILTNSYSGTLTSNNVPIPLSAAPTSGALTFIYSSPVTLGSVNCSAAPASIQIGTVHSAQWQVEGLGPVWAQHQTGDADSCAPQFISVTLDNPDISVGETTQANAGWSACTQGVQWTSTNPSIASVSSSGVVTGLRSGQTNIVASCSIGYQQPGQAALRVYMAEEEMMCNGMIVDDPTSCPDGDDGGTGSGGDGTGGSNDGGCEIWRFRLLRSYDYGETWEVYAVWYEYVGDC